MKKLSFFNALIATLMLMSIGCNKDEQTTPIDLDALTKTAVIKGTVSADLDITQAGLDPAPTGTKILFRIATNQFTNRPHQNAYWIGVATVSSTGNYEIELPVTDAGVNVEILPSDFEALQRIASGTGLDKFERRLFTASQSNVNLVTGQDRFRNIVYQY